MEEQMTDHLATKVSITLLALIAVIRKAVKILHIIDGYTIDIKKIKIIGLFCHHGAKRFLLDCCYMNN